MANSKIAVRVFLMAHQQLLVISPFELLAAARFNEARIYFEISFYSDNEFYACEVHINQIFVCVHHQIYLKTPHSWISKNDTFVRHID